MRTLTSPIANREGRLRSAQRRWTHPHGCRPVPLFRDLLLQCMQEQRLDALVSPMSTVPPRKFTAPREPNANGRLPIGWSFIGQQGFPAITVPAGFTTQIWDRVRESNGGTRLAGPLKVSLPVGVDFIARPFDEAMLFRIASAFEAATRHRRPPPDFGPVPNEP